MIAVGRRLNESEVFGQFRTFCLGFIKNRELHGFGGLGAFDRSDGGRELPQSVAFTPSLKQIRNPTGTGAQNASGTQIHVLPTLGTQLVEVLRHLPNQRVFEMTWQKDISSAGATNLRFCAKLEEVNLIGSPTGNGAIDAVRGKPRLRRRAPLALSGYRADEARAGSSPVPRSFGLFIRLNRKCAENASQPAWL